MASLKMTHSSSLVPRSLFVVNPIRSPRLLAISRSRSAVTIAAMTNETPAGNRKGIPSRFAMEGPANLRGVPIRSYEEEPENRKPRNFKEDPVTMEELDRFCEENLHRFPRVYVDNYYRSMEQLSTYEGFVMDEFDLGPLPLNGFQQVQPEHNLNQARVAAQYALEQKGMDLKLVRIVRANSIAGIYGIAMFITLEASDHCFYETEVCCAHLNEEDIAGVLKVKLFRPAKYYKE